MITVTVTGSNGITTKTYTITVTRDVSNDADLSDLTIGGTSVTGFAAATTSYTVDVENATAQVIVAATASDTTSNVVYQLPPMPTPTRRPTTWT